MGWVILGMVFWFVFFKNSARRCGHEDRRSSARQKLKRKQSASETYRRQAEAEDMNRRMRVMERILDPREDRLRRKIQDL